MTNLHRECACEVREVWGEQEPTMTMTYRQLDVDLEEKIDNGNLSVKMAIL